MSAGVVRWKWELVVLPNGKSATCLVVEIDGTRLPAVPFTETEALDKFIDSTILALQALVDRRKAGGA